MHNDSDNFFGNLLTGMFNDGKKMHFYDHE